MESPVSRHSWNESQIPLQRSSSPSLTLPRPSSLAIRVVRSRRSSTPGLIIHISPRNSSLDFDAESKHSFAMPQPNAVSQIHLPSYFESDFQTRQEERDRIFEEERQRRETHFRRLETQRLLCIRKGSRNLVHSRVTAGISSRGLVMVIGKRSEATRLVGIEGRT